MGSVLVRMNSNRVNTTCVVSSTYLTSAFMRARVSMNRIKTFVIYGEELDRNPRSFEGDQIRIRDAQFSWKDERDGFTLEVDELEIPLGKLTVVGGGFFH